MLSSNAILLLSLFGLLHALKLTVPSGARRISFTKILTDTSPPIVYDGILNHLFRDGANLGPPPEILDEGDSTSGNGFRRKLIPVGIIEKIIDAKINSEIIYTIENPTLFTYPVSFHQATIQLTKEGADTKFQW